MKVLTEKQYRLLAFADCCRAGGINPTKRDISEWLNSPIPTSTSPPIATISAVLEQMRSFSSYSSRQTETDVDHAVRIGWLREEKDAIRITDLGQALYRATERGQSEVDMTDVVVFAGEDPLAYPAMIGQLASYGEGLLVDPYLGLQQFHSLLTGTTLNHFLLSDSGNTKENRSAILTYLASKDIPRTVEVRVASAKKLHDRLVVAHDNKVITFGVSLNGVGKKTTVLSVLPEIASNALRDFYTDLWQNAKPLLTEPSQESAKTP